MTNATAGVLISVYFISYVILQVPIGAISDRIGPRKIISTSCLLLAVGVLWFSYVQNYAEAALSRILIGVGAGGIYIPGIKLIVSWFSSEERATGLGLYSMRGRLDRLRLSPSPHADRWPRLENGERDRLSFCICHRRFLFVAITFYAPGHRYTGRKEEWRRTLCRDSVFTNQHILVLGFILFVISGSNMGLTTWTYSYAVEVLAIPKSVAGTLPQRYILP